MFDGRWRAAVDRTTRPAGRALQRVGITADVLTATGLVSAGATAVAVATGHLLWAVGLLVLTGAHDLFDGPLAKAAGTASVRGAFFDSVTDRVADGVLMGGVAWYLTSHGEGHLVLLPLAVLGVASLVSYERAKAESLGVAAKGGLMERAERMILLGIGFLSSALLVPVLWVLLVLTSATAVGRFVRVWRAAEGPARRPTEARARGRIRSVDGLARSDRRAHRPYAESRWRTRRDGNVPRPVVGAPGESLSRWRARRQEAVTARPERTRRARRAATQPGSSVRPLRRGASPEQDA